MNVAFVFARLAIESYAIWGVSDMSEPSFRVRHGEFEDLEGPARRWGSVSIVPAKITLQGTSFSTEHDLADFVETWPEEVKAIVRPGDDAVWVQGRLMRLFDL